MERVYIRLQWLMMCLKILKLKLKILLLRKKNVFFKSSRIEPSPNSKINHLQFKSRYCNHKNLLFQHLLVREEVSLHGKKYKTVIDVNRLRNGCMSQILLNSDINEAAKRGSKYVIFLKEPLTENTS